MPFNYHFFFHVHLLTLLDRDGNIQTRRFLGSVEIGGVRVGLLGAVYRVVRGFSVSGLVTKVARVRLRCRIGRGRCFVGLMLPSVVTDVVFSFL
jgi:hypothetical protein